MSDAEAKAPVVVDFGTFEVKAGFAGDDKPSIVERTVFREPIDKEITFLSSMNSKKFPVDLSKKIVSEYQSMKRIGAHEKKFGARENYSVKMAPSNKPIVENGFIQDFDAYENIMYQVFNQLNCEIGDENFALLAMLPALSPKYHVEKLCQIAYGF